MISDEELKCAATTNIEHEIMKFCFVKGLLIGDAKLMVERGLKIQEMAQELLQRRQAERAASSWDDAPDWAVSRRPGRPATWVYYDEADHKEIVDGKIFLETLEERPKEIGKALDWAIRELEKGKRGVRCPECGR